MDKAQYLEYLNHYNHKRYDEVTSYFTPDVMIEYYDNAIYSEVSPKTVHGREEFTNSCRSLHEHTREVIELRSFLSEGNLICAEHYTEFHTFQDPPEPSGEGWKKGDVRVMTNWVIYSLENDKMKRVRIAHFRMHAPLLALYKA